MKNMRIESTGTLLTDPSLFLITMISCISGTKDMHSESSELISLLPGGWKRVMDVRREAETTFDWFKSYKDVAHLLRALIPDKLVRILMLGCGNPTLSEDVCPHYFIIAPTYPRLNAQMYDDGYKNIVNVDVRS